jgi:hypothetical protein
LKRLTRQIGIGITVAMMVVLGGVIYAITATPSRTGSSNCSITGEGAIFVRVISDTDGQPVQGATLEGFETYGCGGKPETWQAFGFAQESGGWSSPILPTGVAEAGQFSITVQFSGRSYTNVVLISPLQVTCFTLKVPSGNYSSPMYSANNALSQCLSH